MSILLEAEGLRRSYSGKVVLDLDRIELRRSEVLAVLGPNGAGKSTLFRLLLLLEKPEAGRIRLAGEPVRVRDAAATRMIAGVFQTPHMFAGTVEDNVAFGLKARGVGRTERSRRVSEALSWFGIEKLRAAPVGTLSGGEVRRVAVARALVLEPAVLLLDEPSANLDVAVVRRFRQELERGVRNRAGAVIIITHDPAEAFAMADRVLILEEGRSVQEGSPADLVLSPASPFVAAITGAELLLDGVAERSDGPLVRVRLEGGVLLQGRLAEGEAVLDGTHLHATYRPEDVTLAPAGTVARTSAVNRIEAVVRTIVDAGPLVRVRVDGPVGLTALVTRVSADGLSLAPGLRVDAYLKATAVRVFRAR